MASSGETSFVTLGVFFSAAIHVGLVLFFFAGQQEDAEAAVEPAALLPFEEVELLMWGEVMPTPGALPTIANPAPETREEDVVNVEPQDDQVAIPEEQPEPDERRPQEDELEEDQRRDDRRHNPNRPVNNEALIGSPDGFRGGTSLSATAMANLFSRAQEQLQTSVRAPSTLSASQLQSIRGVVQIYVNREGRVLRYNWIEHTGNRTYDSAVERALNGFYLGSRRLSLPTHHEQAMQQVLEYGFRWNLGGR